MDDRRIGQVLRALRRRRGWRQADVAERAGVSQQTVSVIELGRLDEVDLATLRRVAAALDAGIDLAPQWRGPELPRLLDADHAALVDAALTTLRVAGWETLTEWTFSHYGERGAVDALGWRGAERALLVIEVKSRIVDVGALIAGVDRKVRLATRLLPDERSWRPRVVGAVVVLPGDATAYAVVRRHGAVFESAFPARTVAVRRWIRHPDHALRGIWFLAPTSAAGAMPRSALSRRQRVRRPRSDSRTDPG